MLTDPNKLIIPHIEGQWTAEVWYEKKFAPLDPQAKLDKFNQWLDKQLTGVDAAKLTFTFVPVANKEKLMQIRVSLPNGFVFGSADGKNEWLTGIITYR